MSQKEAKETLFQEKYKKIFLNPIDGKKYKKVNTENWLQNVGSGHMDIQGTIP